MEKIIFAFVSQAPSLAAYEKLNFTTRIVDPTSGLFSVEADLTDYGWMSVLGVLEECKKAGLYPGANFEGQLLTLEKAIAYADKKAAEEELGLEGIEN